MMKSPHHIKYTSYHVPPCHLPPHHLAGWKSSTKTYTYRYSIHMCMCSSVSVQTGMYIHTLVWCHYMYNHVQLLSTLAIHLHYTCMIPLISPTYLKCAQSFTTVSYQGTLALNSKIRSPISWSMQNGKCVYVHVYTCTCTLNNLHFLCAITEESSKARLPTTLCVHFVCVAADFIEVMLL